jgi:hypothetical protein
VSDAAGNRHLESKPGDRVFVHPDGSVVRLPQLPVSAPWGIAAGRRPTVTIEEMDEAIADAALGAQLRVEGG